MAACSTTTLMTMSHCQSGRDIKQGLSCTKTSLNSAQAEV